MKPNESFTESLHPTRKISYEKVNLESNEKDKILITSSPIQMYILRECDVIGFWYASLGDFVRKIGLKPKTNFKNRVLGEVITENIQKTFPLK